MDASSRTANWPRSSIKMGLSRYRHVSRFVDEHLAHQVFSFSNSSLCRESQRRATVSPASGPLQGRVCRWRITRIPAARRPSSHNDRPAPRKAAGISQGHNRAADRCRRPAGIQHCWWRSPSSAPSARRCSSHGNRSCGTERATLQHLLMLRRRFAVNMSKSHNLSYGTACVDHD